MDKKSEREVSELLKQLEASFGKEKKEETPGIMNQKDDFALSPEELINQLEQHLGGTVSSKKNIFEDDYNICGYEIEDKDFLETREEIDTIDEKLTNIVEAENRVDNVSDESEKIAHGSFEVSPEADADQIQKDIDVVSFDENLEDDVITGQQEEEVRKRVESYVLETLEPEVDFSIFDSIAGGSKDMVSQAQEEPCDTVLETTIDTETVVNEYEEEVFSDAYVSSGMMIRFFKRDAENLYDENNEDALAFDYKNFNDADINLALTLGCEEELHSTFGFSRVRIAKNGFRDPAEETSISDSIYAGDGSEYRSYEQTDMIKGRYKKEKRNLYKRFAVTFLLTVFILLFEHVFLMDIPIPYVSDFFAVPWRYYTASIVLAGFCIFSSWQKIFGAFRSMFAMRPDPYMPPAFFALLDIIYLLVVIFMYPNYGLLTYNFVLSIFLLFALADEYMRLTRESMTFDIISDKKPKLSLERFEGEGDLKKDGSYLGRHDFFVEKVNFVGNYFSRVGRIPSRQHTYSIAFLITILFGIVMMFVSSYSFGSLGNAFQSFFFFMMLTVPMPYLVVGTYPFYYLSKGLKKLDSAILDEEVVDEYATTDTIYLGDDEMFGQHGAAITGLRLYNEVELTGLLYYANAVFSNLGAPLCHVFDSSEREIQNAREVKINHVVTGGIEATVDSSHKILLGNIAFIRSKGFFPKRNLDDEQKIENGECSIVYIAIDGVLSAKIYIKYSITKRFEKFVDEMVANGISVGIRSLDPSVNMRMISVLRGNKSPEIEVIHPTANDLVSIGKHSDSGIITGRNSHMIFRILQQCFHIRKIHQKQMVFHIISSILGAGFVTFLMLTNLFTMVPSLLIVIYHLIWTFVGMIYTRSKLK